MMIKFSLVVGLVLVAMHPNQLVAETGGSVTLLVQGVGPVASSKATDESWGEPRFDANARLVWTGFVGHLAQHGWRIGGVLRSKSENVLPRDLDSTGASEGPADVYLLASSLVSQHDGLESRARELATAAVTVRNLAKGRSVRLICYSASGVAARIWMQGAIRELTYEPGTVSHLVTVATPHLGIGGVVSPVSRVWDRYWSLDPHSILLRRINQELDLPVDARYTSVVIQGTGTSFSDTGRTYESYVRYSADHIASLPPLMRYGHDGVVHCLAAQLHLVPAAARYENKTNRPVEVEFCRLQRFYGDAQDPTIHTAAMHDKALWETLSLVLGADPPKMNRKQSDGPNTDCRRWAAQIALYCADSLIQRRHMTGTVTRTELNDLSLVSTGTNQAAVRWKCIGNVTVRRTFRGEEPRRYAATGCFDLTLDRFGRPERFVEHASEIAPVDNP